MAIEQDPTTTPGNGQTPARGPTVIVPVMKKKKRRYSRGMKNAAKMQRGVNKAAARLAGAVTAGLETWRDRSEASSRKRRDGAVKDAMENWARAMSKTLRRASGVPRDLLRPMNTRRSRKRMLAVARFFVSPLSILRRR